MTADPGTTQTTYDGSAIVVGLDGSTDAEAALYWAADFAHATNSGVIAVEALPLPFESEFIFGDPMYPVPFDDSDELSQRRERAHKFLDQYVSAALEGAAEGIDTQVIDGDPAEVQRSVQREGKARVLVLGRRGVGGFRHLLSGSVSEQCVTYGANAVIVVPSKQQPVKTPRTMVVGFDGSAHSRAALVWAAKVAPALSCQIDLLAVWQVPENFPGSIAVPYLGFDFYRQTAADDLDRELAASATLLKGVDINAKLVQGRAADVIVEHAKDVGAVLTVVGSRGRGSVASTLLGSTSLSAMRHSSTPIAIVHSESAANSGDDSTAVS